MALCRTVCHKKTAEFLVGNQAVCRAPKQETNGVLKDLWSEKNPEYKFSLIIFALDKEWLKCVFAQFIFFINTPSCP